MSNKPKIIAWHIPWAQENPYQKLLAEALRAENVEVPSGRPPDYKWLFANRPAKTGIPTVIHMHWLHGLCREGHTRFPKIGVLRFLTYVRVAKALGYRIVWTAHNLLPHDCESEARSAYVRRFIMKAAHGVVYHCHAAKELIEKNFGTNPRSCVVAHGMFSKTFGEPHPRESARAASAELMGSAPPDENTRIFLFTGLLRKYKGLDELVTAFHQLNLPNAELWIAGSPVHFHYDSETEKILAENPRIRRLERYLTNDEVVTFLSAADICVTPYRKILTSGSVLLNANYGLPVIAPNMGCIPENLGEGAQLLYEQGSVESLAASIKRAAEMDRAELASIGEAGRTEVTRVSWEEIGKTTADFYRSLI